MSDENKESRINVEDLPQAEQELTPEEAKDVKGGGVAGGIYVATGDINNDGRVDIITGAGPGSGGHIKVIDGTR